MALEIERKFLLKSRDWMPLATRQQLIRQGFLSSGVHTSTRVRLIDDDATLTVKIALTTISRHEFEYPIPPADAEVLLKACTGFPVIKTRYSVPAGALLWTIDVFAGENAGLEIAEIELDHEHQQFLIPSWIGAEVTSDPRYLNANLTRSPYRSWQK